MTKALVMPRTEEMLLRFAFIGALAVEAPEVLKDLAGLSVEELTKWARRWHLEVPWIIEHAKRTVDLRKRHPKLPVSALWMMPGGVADYQPEDVELVIRWDPSVPLSSAKVIRREREPISETVVEGTGARNITIRPERFEMKVGGASREAAWRATRKAWKAYAAEVERRYRKAGYTRGKQRTGGGNASLDERMSWVVWRVVKGMTWPDIATAAGRPRTTVQTAGSKLCRALGLAVSAE